MAIVIILVCFWLSGMIYINLLRADARAERLRAFVETKRIAVETKQQQSFFDEEIAIDTTLFVKKSIENYQNDAGLNILYIETFNNSNRKLASYKQIIMAE